MATKFDYAGAIQDVDAIIAFFGMDAVLRREGIDDRPCRVVIFDNPREKASELTNPVDRQVYMSPAGLTILPDNELDQLVTFVQPPTIPPVVKEVLPFTCKVKPTAPAGVTVLYEFTVRR